jgi:hypothetical protein
MIRSRTLVWLSLLAIHAASQTASAQTREECIESHVSGQSLQVEGKLLEAKQQLMSCARPACPPVLQSECSQLVERVDASLPTIVIVARSSSSEVDLPDTRLLLDGVPIDASLAGKPIALDPGRHRIRGERAGVSPIEQELVVAQGEKERKVVLDFPLPTDHLAPAPTSSAESESASYPGIPALFWTGSGVAAAGLVVGAVTGALTLSQSSELKKECPDDLCPEAQRDAYDDALTMSRVSTVALAIGGAGAVMALVGLFVPSRPPSEENSRSPSHETAIRVRPTLSPAFIGLSGEF